MDLSLLVNKLSKHIFVKTFGPRSHMVSKITWVCSPLIISFSTSIDSMKKVSAFSTIHEKIDQMSLLSVHSSNMSVHLYILQAWTCIYLLHCILEKMYTQIMATRGFILAHMFNKFHHNLKAHWVCRDAIFIKEVCNVSTHSLNLFFALSTSFMGFFFYYHWNDFLRPLPHYISLSCQQMIFLVSLWWHSYKLHHRLRLWVFSFATVPKLGWGLVGECIDVVWIWSSSPPSRSSWVDAVFIIFFCRNFLSSFVISCTFEAFSNISKGFNEMLL